MRLQLRRKEKRFGVSYDVRLSGKSYMGVTVPSLVRLHKGESHFHSPLLMQNLCEYEAYFTH